MIFNTSSTIIQSVKTTVFKQIHTSLSDYIIEVMNGMLDVNWAVSDVSDLSQIPENGGLYSDGHNLKYIWPSRNVHPIFFDLLDWHDRLIRSPQAPSDLLRAVGKKISRVVDATCGTGRDALQLVVKGHQVLSFERDPIIFLLLKDAYQSLPSDIKARWEIRYGDFLSEEKEIEVLYYDPMFDRSQKSALPRKEMEFFHSILPHSSDGEIEVHLEFFKKFVKRLVVKKDLKGRGLELPLTAQYKGKSIRYDLHQLK